MTNFSRRTFMAGMAAASAPFLRGANDRINLGIIGVGGKGFGQMKPLYAQSEKEGGIKIVAVSDVYSRYRERARELGKLGANDASMDYREVLGRKDVDAVLIATPDHWHARMAVDAMAAGKDVYLQKPMTLTVEEARLVHEAAQKHRRVLQIGSQHLSNPQCHLARKLIEDGAIGELLWAQTTYSRNSETGEWNYFVDDEANSRTIDWTRWLGPAPQRAFSAERFFRWRKYWDYSGGIATDLFYHRLGPILYAMGPQFPARVTASGGIYVQKDREVPDTYQTTIEYPKFFVNISASMANAAANEQFPETIYGHRGTLTFAEDAVVVTPEGKGAAKAHESKEIAVERAHTDNFLACMRDRSKPVLSGELGYQLMVAIKLGVDSYRQGKVKYFDPKTEREMAAGEARPQYEGDGKNAAGGRKKRG